MSKINKYNYEAFLLDFIEGNLLESDRLEMELFLENNPHIYLEINQIKSLPSLTSFETSLSNDFKQTLKKDENTLTPVQLSTILIKEIEFDLNETEKQQLDFQLFNNVEAVKEKQLFALTKLQPEFDVIFQNKEQLKKKQKVIPLFYYSSVAASLLLFLGMYYFFTNKNVQSGTSINSNKYVSLNNVVFVAKSKQPEINVIEKKHDKAVKNKIQNINISNTIEAYSVEKIKNKSLTIIENPNEKNLAIVSETEIEINTSIINNASNENYLSLQQFFSKKIKQQSNQTKKLPQNIVNQKPNAFDLASISAQVIAKLTNKKISFDKKYAADGSVSEFALVTDNFEFSRKK